MEDSDDNYDLNDEDFVTFGQTLQTPSPNQTQNNFIENKQNGPKVSPPSRHHDRKDGKDEKPLTFDWSGFEQVTKVLAFMTPYIDLLCPDGRVAANKCKSFAAAR